jgi:cyanophycin synthetase
MKIKNIRTIWGPNVYHRKPVLIMSLDLESLTDISSVEIGGFISRLLKTLPGLETHRCSPGYVGGFVERLERGTYFAHIVEHITLELSTIVGIDVGYGKSIYGGHRGLYNVVVRFKSENGMKALLNIAVELAESLVQNKEFALKMRLEEVKDLIASEALGPSTQALVDAAHRRNIPWRRLNEQNLIQFGYGKHCKFVQATTTSSTNFIAVDIVQDKFLTKTLLQRAGIPVPAGKVVKSAAEALEILNETKGPFAVKPLDAQQGKGITLGVNTSEEMVKAFERAREIKPEVLIEKFIDGKDFRVLVVNNKVVAAAQRVAAHIIGDGRSTIQELIDRENENPLRGLGHEKPMTKIKIDEILLSFLARTGLNLNSIPFSREEIYLRDTANLSTGGSAIDVTDKIHQDIRFLCERAARIVGLDVCGVDLIAEDISKPIEQDLGVVELNASPGLRMHAFPSQGKERDVGAQIIEHLYPMNSNGRIPIIAISGTNGKTTVARLTSFILSQVGEVGMTSSDGICISGRKIVSGDTSGPISAQVVLNDPSVEFAVLETARGGIVRRGLGFDQCDTALLTNISEDHLGQDGIESIEDILRIKSLIVDCVSDTGKVILNADDPLLAEMAKGQIEKRGRESIFLFSTNRNNILVREHVENGGPALFLDSGWIHYAENGVERRVFLVSEIPLTFQGTAVFQIANVMAAAAICISHNVDLKTILEGLLNFKTTEHNHGRLNLFRLPKGHLIVDYGHNPAAIEAMATLAHNWNSQVTAIVGIPGDRSDELIKKSLTTVALKFDKIIARDDTNLRGRKTAEIPTMLKEIVSEVAPWKKFAIILDEATAVKSAIESMEENELIIVFYDAKIDIHKIVRDHGGYDTDTLEQHVLESNVNYKFTPFKKAIPEKRSSQWIS